MSFVQFASLLVTLVTLATSALAQVGPPNLAGLQNSGSVIVFPKFDKSTVATLGSGQPATEIRIGIVCPKDQTCVEHQQVKIRFHWVCPGGQDLNAKFICKESGFDVIGAVNGRLLFNPAGMTIVGDDMVTVPQAPCPAGYLIGWVIDPANDQPVKFDGLIGTAVIRDAGAALEYSGLPIRADPALPSFPANGSAIATGTDHLTGAPTLVFDGVRGHYEAPAGKLTARGPASEPAGGRLSGETLLTLLTLDVRSNSPNYPTFAELRVPLGTEVLSVSRDFVCWTELPLLRERQNPTAASASASDAIFSGHALKVPFLGISDEPGPVVLLGLVQTRGSRAPGSAGQAYSGIIQRTDGVTPKGGLRSVLSGGVRLRRLA